MPKIVLIQGSLSKESKTAIVIDKVAEELSRRKVEWEIIDLRNLDLQFCDGRARKDYNEDMRSAYKVMESADAYVFGMPVYCYSLSGVLKNFIDITAGAMENKVAGILCNAGSAMSYLAASDLVKILSYESHVVTVQPVVNSNYDDFNGGQVKSKKVIQKIEQMLDALLALV